MDLHLNDLRVIVTAGGSGIGRAIVEAFLAEGARVALDQVLEGVDEDRDDVFLALGVRGGEVGDCGHRPRILAVNEKRPRRGRGRTLRILPQPPP